MPGTVFVVATPIGNYADISFRALETLKNADFIICEETKPAMRLLSKFEIVKDLIELNEHTESDAAEGLVKEIIEKEQSVALISDCGTPLLADPGRLFIDLCHKNGLKVVPVPGVSSITTALMVAGFDSQRFTFYGWVNAKKEERATEFRNLARRNEIIVLLETPYRLQKITTELELYFGADTPVFMGYELTNEEEFLFRGTASELVKYCDENELKGEFVLIVDNRGKVRTFRPRPTQNQNRGTQRPRAKKSTNYPEKQDTYTPRSEKPKQQFKPKPKSRQPISNVNPLYEPKPNVYANKYATGTQTGPAKRYGSSSSSSSASGTNRYGSSSSNNAKRYGSSTGSSNGTSANRGGASRINKGRKGGATPRRSGE